MNRCRTKGDPRTTVRASRLKVALTWTCVCVFWLPCIGHAQSSKSTPSNVKATVKAVRAQTPVVTDRQWEEAVNAFRYQDFDQAIPKFRSLLYPKPRIDETRAWRAREYLAASLWWSQKRKAADDEFTALLVRNPGAKLDPAYYPPQMLKDLEKLRSNLIRLGVIKRGVVRKPRAKSQGEIQPPAMALTLFPFGVGQFANRQMLKGGLFMGSQLALASASAILYVYNRDMARQGQRSTSAAVGQVTTGGLFWGLVFWGITDALLTRRSQDRRNMPRP